MIRLNQLFSDLDRRIGETPNSETNIPIMTELLQLEELALSLIQERLIPDSVSKFLSQRHLTQESFEGLKADHADTLHFVLLRGKNQYPNVIDAIRKTNFHWLPPELR